ncbi:MAG: energy transducer TonB [Candidatus Angelobacter sp.]
MIFAGSQEIVSNPFHADNKIQTVRQPDIPKLALKIPFASSNIVQVASPSIPVLAPQPSVIEVNTKAKSGQRMAIQAQPREATVKAKLTLPVSGSSGHTALSSLVNANAAVPQLAQPQQRRLSPAGGSGTDERNLLVLNAMPSPSLPDTIPAGELSGEFNVSPYPASGSNPALGTGRENRVAGGDATPPEAGNGIGVANNPGGGVAVVIGKGTRKTAGLAGDGSGMGEAPGVHDGSTTGLFPGISIAEVAPLIKPARRPPALHGTYGMTIIATGSSGGGLKDYGVFRNEAVYTVYVDMSETGHVRPNWTLQYAANNKSSQPGSVLVPPFPGAKEYPRLPQEATERNLGRTVVVAGLITNKGKFNSLRVIQSPNPLLIQPVLDCLSRWSFQAAELDGEPVTVKFVLGIPISADLAEEKQ